MPNLKTWHDYKNIYSVDMMFAYLNSVKHPILDPRAFQTGTLSKKDLKCLHLCLSAFKA